MALNRTVNLLPEIFRTDTNRKFLAATLDQLTQEPNLKKTQGYVGRRVGPGVNPADNYVVEPTAVRTDYQLEPGVVFLKPNTGTAEDAITYPGMIDSLALQNAKTNKQDRLWESEYYSWDPFCDLDKFTNYSQYYWLPGGPDSVNVSSTDIPLTDDFIVTRNVLDYTFSGVPGKNPIVYLARGGTYNFTTNQAGHAFWIQSAPGITGTLPSTPNISSRDVLGVVNNGSETGVTTFYVPAKTAQDFYYTLPTITSVDLVSDLQFSQINNIRLSAFLEQYPTGIDGESQLDGKTLIFSNTIQDAAQGGWQIITDSSVTNITSQSQRYSVWTVRYVYDSGLDPLITLSSTATVPNLTKFSILYGTTYSVTQWYKDSSGYFEQVPLLTAVQDVLYYQDGSNPEIRGEIRLIDFQNVEPIDINDIVGAKNYTSPNGVVFTNGLKVQFRGPTVPAQFENLEYYVEGVGTGPGGQYRVGFIDGEAYFGMYHLVNNQKVTGTASDTTFQQYIYDTVEESLANTGAGTPLGAPLPQVSVPGADLGNGIRLVPVDSLVTPETYTKNELIPYDSLAYDVGPYDDSLNSPLIQDYITQNRSSSDRNAWSRSNRWFHIDVINYTSELNNITPVINNAQRASRPIIEFRANLRLWNMGTLAKDPVNIIDFTETDALSNINGQTGYGIDGYTFLSGTRVIFAADLDAQVRNRIYEVTFIDPNNSGKLIIDLVPAYDSDLQLSQTVVCLNGATLQGISFWFDGVTWQRAQEKTNVNQPPLFDVYDIQGRSFGDRTAYPSSSFEGCRLFGYAEGMTSTVDAVLGLSLKYLNINNVGDIVFQNYLYSDNFIYVTNNISTEVPVSTGFVRQYIDRVTFSNQIGWQTAAATSRSRQVFRFVADGSPLVLDVPVDQAQLLPAVQVFIGSAFIDPGQYSVVVSGNNTTITFSTQPVVGSIIEVLATSNQASSVAFYEIPINLENNAQNGNSTSFTLGTIRTHYETIAQNLKLLTGPINGANNSRDLGDIIPYGTNIIQNSSPLLLAGVFLRRQQYELFNSLNFNSQEYTKYKALLLDLAARGNFINLTPTQVLDTITQEIALTRNESFPFFWTDMLPAGETYTDLSYTVTPITTGTFDTTAVYDLTSSNYQAVLVYLNGNILTLNRDYTVPVDTATVVVSVPLAVGDVVTIREYATTYGSFVPNTPTKMGLYPAWQPKMYLDETYLTPTMVIQGHDGSITVAFDDVRDAVLLEFETRIYNNLKIHSRIPLTVVDVVPGQFRDTNYTLTEINNILTPDFLSWIGWNKLDYVAQDYVAGNPFTYNYSQSGNKLNQQPLLGAWRGIYNYFYDTMTPNTTPWEMLGFAEEPDWWQDYYGPAPYTSGNLVLWQDLEAGFIADPNNPRFAPEYARPGLTQVIPSGSQGELLPPTESVVGNYDTTSFRRSWVFGDDGPVESTWKTSSAWPFSVMRLLALTKPAEFFSLFVDRDRYVYDTTLNQYLWDQRYRLTPENIAPLNGSKVSRASYMNWIIDYNRQRGVDSSVDLAVQLNALDVRLCWRMSAFSDKRYLKIYTERSTLGGTNASLLLPDESYQLLLYQNPPFNKITYSSVVVQVVDGGWAVYGYNNSAAYFEILASKPNGLSVTISAGGSAERVPVEYTNTIVQVPYGYVFTNRAAVCDFLYSYGELLTQRGLEFEGIENGYIMNWQQMAQEFLYWSNQGWQTGTSIINLNPGATSISVTQPGAVVESIFPPRLDSVVLNQNRTAIPPAELVIDRLENTFKITSINSNTINFLNLRFTAYEHLMVLDNRSIFADLLYDPITGARQSRVLVAGWLSGDWNGTVNAPGFVLNQDNIREWIPNRKYSKGEIVLFKDQYWSANSIVQPSATFDFNAWIKSDYNEIQQGLLPNAANVSDQLAQSYSVYDANLETEIDLFSYGLIGFRPRQYMQALNLDDVSQVQLYQQFLGSKGTRPSLEIFSYADLGKETAQYDIYEYWAILRSTYGANANRSYFDLLLNASKLISDPALVQIINPGTTSQADQTVFVQDILKSNYKITSPNILPTTLVVPDNALPSAGYVDLEDVDITVFDLSNNATLNAQLDNIGVATTIWVARVNTYDWAIYRSEKVPGAIVSVEDNLNNNSIVTFNQAHGLTAGDTVIIKYFSDAINGAYQVLSVPSIYTIIVDYTFTGFQTTEVGNGFAFTLQPCRVHQPSDIKLLPYANELLPGSRAWVDDNSFGRWTVLEKTDPFVQAETLTPFTPVTGSRYGSSIAQGLLNVSALVGAPGYNPANQAIVPGAVYVYVKTDQDVYDQNTVLTLNATNASGYGNSMDIGNKSWAIVGASDSNYGQGYAATIYVAPGTSVFEQRQLLISPTRKFDGGEFGYSVTMSLDEHWIYVSSPGHNEVHAYARTEVQQQFVDYITDGVTATYNWSDSILIDYTKPGQLSVRLEDRLLSYPGDYLVNSSNIVLNSPPVAGQQLSINRKYVVQLDQKFMTGVAATGGSGSGATFTVNNVRGVYTVNLDNGGTGYTAGNTLTILGTDVETQDSPASNPANNITITVDTVDGSGKILSIVDPVSGDGVSTQDHFDLTDYLATAVDIYSFTVTVNDVLMRPEIDYDFNSDSSFIDPMILVFTTPPPAGARIIVNSSTYFSYVATLPTDGLGLTIGDRFGHSISCNSTGSHITVGTPNIDNDAGRAFVFDRNIQQFIVSDATQTKYYTEQSLETPGSVMVSLNGTYLLPTTLNFNGGFDVDVSDPSNQFVNITATLNVGDVIEVSTNQFTLLEVVDSVGASSEAQFGYKVDQCINDCSWYVSAPFDSSILTGAGRVEFWQNQSRVYGTTTSTVANPTLTTGDFIRIDNMFVAIDGTTVADLVDSINSANIPNVVASLTSNLTLEADGTSKVYDIGNIYAAAGTIDETIVYVDNVLQTYNTDYVYNNTTQQITFTNAPFNTAEILIVSGRVTISVKNYDASTPGNRLQVLPGTGTLFDDVGFNTYIHEQTIASPVPQVEAHFGQGLFISDDTTTLLVGAPNGSMIRATTFDLDQTRFDSDSTNFADPTPNSGAVYSFDSLPSNNPTASNPLQFVFGQQFVNNNVQSKDQFGYAVDLSTGLLLIGSPGTDFNNDSQTDFGQVIQYHNLENLPAWQVIRLQQPFVDVNLLDTVFIYDNTTSQPLEYFDYFDPLQGRILGAVRQNINYIGAVDPAAYNTGTLNNYGVRWAEEYVGQIWWDTNNVRFIDPHQSQQTARGPEADIVYASRRWGQVFPGSSVDVYQWIVSSVPPIDYTGPGTPKDTTSYTVLTSLDLQGFLTTQYYFWVSGLTTVATSADKTLSITSLARYIENPRSSGIPYIAPITSSTVAIYNGLSYINSLDSVLHIEYDKQATDDAVHVEYQLIAQDRPESFLNATLYRKLLDSLSGEDTAGNAVPDPFLTPTEQYGIQFRPRQSMVMNRFLALKNYITQTNTVLAQFPIAETRQFNLLNSSEPEPSSASGAWNKRVANQEELSYQDLLAVPLGYKYLVASDSTQNGLWTIYEVQASVLPGVRDLGLVRVQNYDTRRYWNYINWYSPTYNQYQRILLEVPNRSSLDALTVPVGSAVRVTANSINKWEIYLLTATGWVRVGLQDGTIELSSVIWDYAAGRFGFDSEVFDAQYYDQAPIIETRQIIKSINEELFIGDLLIERNRLLVLMFNYILSEQLAPVWLTKTSLIDVDHTIRELLPYPIYRADNQDFVLNYINEVKPYHVQIREFNLKYRGSDQYFGSLTDFDLPAYYDNARDMFISPVLDNTGTLSTTSSLPSSDPIWYTFPWNQWYQNYLLSIQSVVIYAPGSGYTEPPIVTVTGDCIQPAVMTAQINTAGEVVGITIVDPGQGYSTTAVITLDSSTGTGAEVYAVMGNNMIRSIATTIKYDRYQYSTTILTWEPNVSYNTGQQVRYADRVWSANANNTTSVEFDSSQWTLVPAGDLSGVDRTMGYYVPTVNQPGLDLGLLISGVDYPGVQVSAPGFDQNAGFDVGNFDMTPYDNISISAEGFVTYDPAILDAIYASNFVDPYLGTRPTDVNVDGGAFVDTYESHAPEELVPGITYDTLDLRVFTTPGADWARDGHGFPLRERNFVYNSLVPNLDFSGLLYNPVTIEVYNQTTGVNLNLGFDYVVDWVNYVVTITSPVVNGNVLTVVAYALGGGNQLFTQTYVGDVVGDALIVPMTESLVTDVAVFVNGIQYTDFTFTAVPPSGYTLIEFATTFTDQDRVSVILFGGDTATNSWSLPVTQYIVSDGSLTYNLTNSLQGTNPINVIVNKNGIRAIPSETSESIGTGFQTVFPLPDGRLYDLDLVSDNDVAVFVDDVQLILGVGFTVQPPGTVPRSVVLASAPPPVSRVLVSVRTRAQYWIVNNQITFIPSQGFIPTVGDIISVTTWNNTNQQNILTQVFAGPETSGTVITQPYDSTVYDEGAAANAPGSYDYSEGILIQNNRFNVGRLITDPERLVVTLNGRYLFNNQGYTVSDTYVLLTGPIINAASIVVITSFANDVVPDSMAFRIFQDMRGQQYTYRITHETSTELVAPLLASDDVVYVADASVLGEPELAYGIFGIITVNGERITYRDRDTVLNTVSGLRRGTAGTAAADHAIGAPVYDMSRGNLLPAQYQNYTQAQNFLANGSTITFVATDISVADVDSTERLEAVMVYVGGTLQTDGYTISSADPLTVVFTTAPESGYQVSIQVNRGVTWYAPGTSTPSNGVPLQQTNTVAARFLRGVI